MKIVELKEVSADVKKQLEAANVYQIVLTSNTGDKLRGYLVDEDNTFWGVKIEVNKPIREKK